MNIINRGELYLKKKILIIVLIIIILALIGKIIINNHQKTERPDVKIPVLLYHNFVNTVPETDPDKYPIIKKYNVKVSIFVVTDKIGKEIDGIKYLSWNDCLEMQNSGLVEIFSHGKKACFLRQISDYRS